MGDRSDRQYHGTNNHSDWAKGKSPRNLGGFTSDIGAMKKNREKITAASYLRNLERFRHEGGEWRKDYEPGIASLFMNTSEDPFDRQIPAADIPNREFRCSVRIDGERMNLSDCKNAADLLNAINELYEGKQGSEKSRITSRLNKSFSFTLHISEQQMEYIKSYYNAVLARKETGQGR